MATRPSSSSERRYGDKASEKVERAMHEMKEGTLRSGGSGRKVTSRKQAIAIGLSEARAAGGKVPKAPSRKAKKAPAKRAKAPATKGKKAPSRRSRKASTRKSPQAPAGNTKRTVKKRSAKKK